MKPLVIYHNSCADGFGAAFAAWLKLGDEAEYVPCQYGQVKNVADLNSILSSAGIPFGEGEVYVLDFSFPKDVMEWLFKEVKRVVWLDHHKTAFEMWCGKAPELFFTMHKEADDRKYILLDDCKSGAYLAWKYFHPDTEVPLFIRHIDDYDRWQFKIDGTKAFNKAIWSHAPWSFKQWVEWFYDRGAGFTHKYWADFYTEGEAIIRAHDQNVQSWVKGAARKVEIELPMPNGGWKTSDLSHAAGLAANCPPHLTSDVGHELANQSSTFGLCWCLDKDNICKCSLRSNGDYDVSAIAKAFGGGGHRNAAGFTTSIQTLLEWIK